MEINSMFPRLKRLFVSYLSDLDGTDTEILSVLRLVALTDFIAHPNGLTANQIRERSRISFFFFWQRKIGFSDIYPRLRKLENLGYITSSRDTTNPSQFGACDDRYYQIVKK